MTVQSVFTVPTAPEITAAGVTDIITKLAPFAFESGMNVTMCASFDEFLEKVTFTLEFTSEAQSATDAVPFLAAVRAHEELLASRLEEARGVARFTREQTLVSLDGIEMDPTWPALALTAGPSSPDITEDEAHHD